MIGRLPLMLVLTATIGGGALATGLLATSAPAPAENLAAIAPVSNTVAEASGLGTTRVDAKTEAAAVQTPACQVGTWPYVDRACAAGDASSPRTVRVISAGLRAPSFVPLPEAEANAAAERIAAAELASRNAAVAKAMSSGEASTGSGLPKVRAASADEQLERPANLTVTASAPAVDPAVAAEKAAALKAKERARRLARVERARAERIARMAQEWGDGVETYRPAERYARADAYGRPAGYDDRRRTYAEERSTRRDAWGQPRSSNGGWFGSQF